MNLPGGIVTFLLTDIEGSTQAWERAPDSMRLALTRHDEIGAEIVAAHGGLLVKKRGEGDSLFIVFAEAAAAVAAACALQIAFYREDWPAETPLRVRMALHTGEADLRDGDYYGTTVNRCARLRAIGHGGQTLLSSATLSATQSALPDNVSFRFSDKGAHRLKDLQQPEQVWQLLHPDLPENFPELNSLKLPNNLPTQLTSFIGREKEIADVRQRLETTRLLTITGSGGSGKTRLALQVAAELLDRQTDGVWQIELASLTEAVLVPQAVASVLKIREEPDRPILQTLCDALSAKKILLVLDNCEHLLAATARMADTLLRTCPNVKILASSREGLGITGEKVYRLPSLAMPDGRKPIVSTVLVNYDAVRLFMDRAVAVAPTFAINTTNAPTVAQVCRRLDGIPFAIELAAARMRVMPIEQIATRLDDRFRLLTGGSRTALPRQKTLRATMDWSYDLLTDADRRLLRRLSVFSGGWTLEAAEAVCPDTDAQQPPPEMPIETWEILDFLTSLVDKSLVIYEESGGKSRYRLLETVRQYSTDRLAEENESEIYRRKHAEFYLNFAERAGAQLMGPEQGDWLRQLDIEHDNIRVAQEWYWASEKEGVAGLRIVGALWRFWMMRGHLSEGKANSEAVLDRPDAQEPTEIRANALKRSGDSDFGTRL